MNCQSSTVATTPPRFLEANYFDNFCVKVGSKYFTLFTVVDVYATSLGLGEDLDKRSKQHHTCQATGSCRDVSHASQKQQQAVQKFEYIKYQLFQAIYGRQPKRTSSDDLQVLAYWRLDLGRLLDLIWKLHSYNATGTSHELDSTMQSYYSSLHTDHARLDHGLALSDQTCWFCIKAEHYFVRAVNVMLSRANLELLKRVHKSLQAENQVPQSYHASTWNDTLCYLRTAIDQTVYKPLRDMLTKLPLPTPTGGRTQLPSYKYQHKSRKVISICLTGYLIRVQTALREATESLKPESLTEGQWRTAEAYISQHKSLAMKEKWSAFLSAESGSN